MGEYAERFGYKIGGSFMQFPMLSVPKQVSLKQARCSTRMVRSGGRPTACDITEPTNN